VGKRPKGKPKRKKPSSALLGPPSAPPAARERDERERDRGDRAGPAARRPASRGRARRRSRGLAIGIGILAIAAVGGAVALAVRADGEQDEQGPAEQLTVRVVRELRHDTDAFTQGLVYHRGKLYESTGLEGQSSIREVELRTGRVLRRAELPDDVFAEGLALVNDRLVQLSYRNHKAFVWRLDPFERVREHRYTGEGWGLCYDGEHLVMSNGSENLTFRDPRTFQVRRTLRVVDDRRRGVRYLNELECVDGQVYANVWQSDDIVRIDPESGRLTARIDASSLEGRFEDDDYDVLNGIAHVPETGHFLLTGKLWPKLFEVELVPVAPR
jgi:glutamine cyclotransferase